MDLDEYFFSHSAKGKEHLVLVIESDSKYLNLSPVNICLSIPLYRVFFNCFLDNKTGRGGKHTA